MRRAQEMAKQSSNLGKVKITNVHTGKFFFKDPETAKQLLENKRFGSSYIAEAIAETPKELTEEPKEVKKPKPEAASDNQADDSTN